MLADVGVRDGRIVSVGSAAVEGARADLDVSGLMVAPGFVDIHTHYDAQLAWDPSAAPSPLHGVTTVFGGNCGFGLAPAGPEDAGYLSRMMAEVEGIPLAALEAALEWNWDSFGSWLARFDGHIGVNAGFLAGHSTLRRAAMGARAVGEQATMGDVSLMVRLLHEAIDAGALGFSTSQAPTHRDGDRQPVPSRAANEDELLALARAVRDHEGTTVELILPGCLNQFSEAEVDLMTEVSLAAGRPVNWNVLGVSAMNPTRHLDQLEASTRAAARGARIVALTLPHSMTIRLSFLSGAVLSGLPGWSDVLGLEPDRRLAALADPGVRARLAAGAGSEEAGILRHLADWKRLRILETFSPDNEGLAGRSVGDVASARGCDPFDALLDVVGADQLRTGLSPPMPAATEDDWKLRAGAWKDDRTVVGGSDAGAHLDMMCGAVYSTSLLASVREHATVPWEQAVRQLTDVPASLYGLRDRGRVAPGHFADLTVFDPASVAPGPERTLEDLPGGAARLFAGSTGVEHVFVNGTAVVAGGRLTGATPGTVLRSGRDTYTVSVAGASAR